MPKRTFSLDCSDAAEQLDLPPIDALEVDGFHLLAQVGDHLIVCVHDQHGETHQMVLPLEAREALPEDEDLVNHFTRLLNAPLN